MNYKDLLNTNDILHLLTNKLNFTLKQMGRSIFFLCPFHDDKNPSLSFEPNRKIFTCFTCGFKANDIFSFWTQYKKISLELALEEISQMGFFSLSILQEKKKKQQNFQDKKKYLFSLVSDIYQHNLFTKLGKEILDYLQNKRQINSKLISHFSLGCSINNQQISNLLFSQKNGNFSSEDLLSTNLVWVTSNNRIYDFFSAKDLIIPLTDKEGKIIAFVARKIGETLPKEGKYKYLPSYQHYYKSSLLYNYHIVKRCKEKNCYLVEGFFDVISLTKLGIENCMALLGTNLSEKQIKLLAELKKSIIIFLDGDKAGKEATIDISIKLLSHEIDCEIIKYSYQDDPDEICQHSDKETINNILQTRENPYIFILNYYFVNWEIKENPQRISRFISEIAKIFRKFKTNIHNFLIEKLSLLTKWNKKEVEYYFIHPNFLAPNIYHSQIMYCREIIKKKEKKIIYLCIQERIFWLIVAKKDYFFLDKSCRDNYRNIYNYYTASPHNKFFDKQNLNSDKLDNEFKFTSLPPRQIITTIFQEIENIKEFLTNLNHEQNNS